MKELIAVVTLLLIWRIVDKLVNEQSEEQTTYLGPVPPKRK